MMRCYLCDRRIRPWDRYGLVGGVDHPLRAWHRRCMARVGEITRDAIQEARRQSLRGLFPKASDAALDRAIAYMDSARKGLS